MTDKKPADVKALRIALQKHVTEVGRVRDNLRDFLEEAHALQDSCDRAYDELHSAVDALSEWA